MKYGFSVILLLGTALSACLLPVSLVAAERKPVVRVFSLQSDRMPLEVVSRDPFVNNQLLELSEKTVANVMDKMDQDRLPFGKMNISWRPESSEESSVPVSFSFPRSMRIEGGRVELDIEVWGDPVFQKLAIQRTIIIGLLQSYIWQDEKKFSMSLLPEPPLWLSEGLLWDVAGYRYDDWREVVAKASRTRKMPSLKTIQGWEELSELGIERAWQQAFCYCLYENALQSTGEKRAVLLWLKKFKFPFPDPFWANSSETENWWKEAAAQPLQQKLPVMSWQKTAASLNQLRHFSLKMQGGDRKMFLLQDLPEGVEIDRKDAGLNEYLARIDQVTLSAHFSLNPVLIRYRKAFLSWVKQDYATYQKMINEAAQWEEWVISRRQSAQDMLDWAVVNLELESRARNSVLIDYVAVVRELENERYRLRREFQSEIFNRSEK
jgi:hypothetical protein